MDRSSSRLWKVFCTALEKRCVSFHYHQRVKYCLHNQGWFKLKAGRFFIALCCLLISPCLYNTLNNLIPYRHRPATYCFLKKWSLWCYRYMKNIDLPKIFYNRKRKSIYKIIFAVFLPLNLCLCPAKLWSNADFAPQNYWGMQTLPRKIMEQCRFCPAKSWSLCFSQCKIRDPSLFALQNYGAMQTLPP